MKQKTGSHRQPLFLFIPLQLFEAFALRHELDWLLKLHEKDEVGKVKAYKLCVPLNRGYTLLNLTLLHLHLEGRNGTTGYIHGKYVNFKVVKIFIQIYQSFAGVGIDSFLLGRMGDLVLNSCGSCET